MHTCWQHHACLTAGMIYSAPARTPTRRIPRFLVAGLIVVIAPIAAVLGYSLLATSSSTAVSPIDVPRSEQPRPQLPPPRAVRDAASPADGPRGEHPRPQPPPRRAVEDAAAPIRVPRGEHRGALGESDGVVPDGTTVFDDEISGVAKLNPALLGALHQAARDAANDGIKLYVTSGWRSPKYAEQLRREAISKYGSEKEAARWVATPNTSAHVSGDAVDIGPSVAAAWLAKHGAKYGLCQTYRNEPWHYELRPVAISRGCPPMYADATHDPRMQQ
jgi:zinc D-Ala-D-Ala carboxypeptidase